MFDGIGGDNAERMIDDWQAGFERRAAQARELAGRVEGLTGSARSQDRLVEVTVGRSGEVTDLWLDEDTRQQSATRTAREILATIAAARADLSGRVREAVAGTIGVESEAGRAVLKGYATDEDDA
ncbi:YbaB/EbfC family nucleoid-associated protein [Paractinoplanes atraurantiacus]|uniref:YbaB/EbfC DNA-binding family protein n=1 Tax=Paractinoplanes atraurantiacus TaxID=1036182 RepID=A0A285KN42_9ACTN|nr:YbaB/EbfC family nucleoid-associated protein [Actinoplanes atraurantiacus]SNY74054.1 YbaB/EbfC DNA-binding family protein [Actinoplanes atraurantiacus]